MSQYIPYGKVVKEQIAQAVRKSVGLKSGAYVRVKLGPKIGTILKHRAETEGFIIISEEEFQQRASGTFKKPVTDAGTAGEPKIEPLEKG